VSIQSDIYDALAAANIADGDIYPQAVPEDVEVPYVAIRKESSEPLMTFAGYAGATKSIFVFECYADSPEEAVTLAGEVRVALEASALSPFREPGDPDDHVPSLDVYMEPVLFSFWHS
jgi:hypothetical protein